jgi:hypothetical protein
MSNDLAMTMDELVRESAELLPARETLCVAKYSHHSGGNTYSYTSNNFEQVAGNSSGFINIPILSDDVINVLSF